MKLKDKVAVVTGASSGMGRAIALAYAKEGAKVVAVARRQEMLDALVNDAKGFEGEIVAYKADISLKESVESILDFAVEKFGKLDILVNNAGVMDQTTPIGEVTDELWNKVMGLNVNGPMYAMRKAVNIMLKQGGGNIINVASLGSLKGGIAGCTYIASKFALLGMTKNTAYMYANKGIRCNAICPGGVRTEIITKGVGADHPSAFGIERAMLGMGANPRLGEPEEIASVAVFLASEDSSFVNGIALIADGGWSAY